MSESKNSKAVQAEPMKAKRKKSRGQGQHLKRNELVQVDHVRRES